MMTAGAILPTADFDWADESVAIHGHAAVAVYRNRVGEVVIRQGEIGGDGTDVAVIVAPEHAEAIAAAILEAAGVEAPTPRRSKDRTAADRQRRYRERKRNGVTGRNGHGVTLRRDGEV